MITDIPAFLAADDQAAKSAIAVWLAPQKNFARWLEAAAPNLQSVAAAHGFAGEKGRVVISPDGVLVGLGDGRDHLILGAASAVLPANNYRLANNMAGEALDLACVGWALGAYRFDRYRAQRPIPKLVVPAEAETADIARQVRAHYLARDLVNTPAEDMGPDALEERVREIATEFGAKVKVTTGKDLLKANLPMIHAVGRAAAIAPRLIDVSWGNKKHPKLTLVGKGVCFDSGGLNIKGGASMMLMKKDMGGSANALALAMMIMAANLPVQLRLLIPAVENAISANAYRPSDILHSRKGLTVEVGNTDAEGRLVLADALTLAGEDNPEMIISLATLTGAARVALGPELPPLYATDDDFATEIAQYGQLLEDPTWRMPFWDNYNDTLASSVADLSHISGDSFAGSVVAALFLKKFVPDGTPYTHLDIYAWNPKDRPAHPKGGEAQGVRALFRAVKARYEK
ncbi:MAG: leucyl aminopeptidase family protein [Parvularculaceae bacterium]